MKTYLFSLLLLTSERSLGTESKVYNCHSTASDNLAIIIRMKEYWNTPQSELLGQIDILDNGASSETHKAKVIQIPLLDGKNLVQIWLGRDIRLDAQLAYKQGYRKFFASVYKNQISHDLVCWRLAP